MKRIFSLQEKRALYIAAQGRCQLCGEPLPADWHGDHVKPWSLGGDTDVFNGQALCPTCNRKKGANMLRWRNWQTDCFDDWVKKDQRDYLIAATPGSGKSAMALRIAKKAKDDGQIERIVVIVPTEFLKYQWKDKAHDFGIELDPENRAGLETADYHGMITTYQAVAVGQSLLQRTGTRRKTFVIFDEIHHAGDGAWGQKLKEAFEYAEYRLSLSGTPFRSDSAYIPFISYEQETDGIMRSSPDFYYGYGDALADNVLKCIDFIYIDGQSNWTFNGDDHESYLSEDTDDTSIISQRLRSALNVDQHGISEWVRESLTQANAKLEELRQEIRNDSAGIIFVENQFQAKIFETNKEIRTILGGSPTVVYSDKPESKQLITNFKNAKSKWIVSVKQISEGVDIPRLAVFVYATIEKTDLIFRQRIARVLRIEEKYPENTEAFGYIPADDDIKALALEIEKERDHVIESEDYGISLRDSIGQREIFEFIPGQTLDVSVKGVISGTRIYEVSQADAKEIAEAAGVSIDSVIKVLHVFYSKQSNEPVKVGINRSERAVADQIRDMQQNEDRAVKKLVGIIYKTSGGNIGAIKKKIYTDLWGLVGKGKSECTIADMQTRQGKLKEWIHNGHCAG